MNEFIVGVVLLLLTFIGTFIAVYGGAAVFALYVAAKGRITKGFTPFGAKLGFWCAEASIALFVILGVGRTFKGLPPGQVAGLLFAVVIGVVAAIGYLLLQNALQKVAGGEPSQSS